MIRKWFMAGHLALRLDFRLKITSHTHADRPTKLHARDYTSH